MKYPWLFVGAKIVCVDATPLVPAAILDGLKAGAAYTVRWVGIHDIPHTVGQQTCVRLEEIHRSKCPRFGTLDMPFLADRFRPVLPDTTHIIEQLKASLPKRGRVDA